MSPRAKPAERVSTGEPAQSPVERVTEKKAKDPKMVATGRAGAAARTAAQKQLLKQLQADKELLHPGDGTSASTPPKELNLEYTDEQPEHNRNLIPWIIGACLAGSSLAYASRNMCLRASPRRWRQATRPKFRICPPTQSN